MRTKWLKRTIWVIALAVVLAGIAWFAWPRPIAVDIATVATGPMEVTVDDEARTRVRHIYTVSAPVAGKVLRISEPAGMGDTSLHAGDPVTAGETIVAVMQPMAPSLLDIRSREELKASAAAADAAVKLAGAEMRRIEAALAFSRDELRRPSRSPTRIPYRPRDWRQPSSTPRRTKPPWKARRRSSTFGGARALSRSPG